MRFSVQITCIKLYHFRGERRGDPSAPGLRLRLRGAGSLSGAASAFVQRDAGGSLTTVQVPRS
jgi:hypothetical protein